VIDEAIICFNAVGVYGGVIVFAVDLAIGYFKLMTLYRMEFLRASETIRVMLPFNEVAPDYREQKGVVLGSGQLGYRWSR
jgi:hypothetical protein